MSEDHIKALAQKCARANLSMSQANSYFTTLYLGDALAVCGGNVTAAAERAGISRGSYSRALGRRLLRMGNYLEPDQMPQEKQP